MVHHIQALGNGGPTHAKNLITLCMRCHGLVHADFLVIRGEHQAKVFFVDQEGRSLHEQGQPLAPGILTRLDRRRVREADRDPMGRVLSQSLARQLAAQPDAGLASTGLASTGLASTGFADRAELQAGSSSSPAKWITLDDLPAEVDVHWWRKNSHLFSDGKGGRFKFTPGFAVESPRTPYCLHDLPSDRWVPLVSSTPWAVRIGHPGQDHRSSASFDETADVRRFA